MDQQQAVRQYAKPARVLVAVLSALVLLITGFAWRGIDTLRDNLATTNLGLGGAKDGAVDILLVGTDSRTDAHGNPLSDDELASLHAGADVSTNTDTIVLIRVPNDGSSATAISIPRDSYVDIPGIGKAKINGAYGSTKEAKRIELVEDGASDAEADKKSTEAGRQALVDTVAKLTGITVDHYAEIGLLGFVLLTDAVGGVDVCLNNPVSEPFSGAYFPAGEQTLHGGDALSFVRQRHDLDRGDLDRIVRQQAFMASLAAKVLSAQTLSNPGKLQELSNAISRSVVLDSNWDILGFAQQLQDLAGGTVKFETIPVVELNGMTDAGESIVRVDPASVKTYVAKLAGEEASVDRSGVTVNVANDSGIDGLAGRVGESLSALGYKTGTIGNYSGEPIESSVVLAKHADDEKADTVANDLGIAVREEPTVADGQVRVVLATDYAGPGGINRNPEAGATSTEIAVPPDPPIDAGQEGPKCVN